MSSMEHGAAVVRPEPPVAELHLHRGPGLVYGVLAIVLLALGVVISVSYLADGRWAMALCGIPLLLLTWFFLRVSLPMLRTRLTADTAGVRGRTPDDRVIDVGWSAVGIDAHPDEDGLLLTEGEETFRLSAEGWVGFGNLVAVLTLVPDATRRLTPAARTEVAGYLERLTGPA
jgi:hypothetical protein